MNEQAPSNERTNPSDYQVRALMQRYRFSYPIMSDLADLIRDAWRQGQSAHEPPDVPQSLNEWFCALPSGRQAILASDKWMLAEAAYQAGMAASAQPPRNVQGAIFDRLGWICSVCHGWNHHQDVHCTHTHSGSVPTKGSDHA
jgi:hypothetical protein